MADSKEAQFQQDIHRPLAAQGWLRTASGYRTGRTACIPKMCWASSEACRSVCGARVAWSRQEPPAKFSYLPPADARPAGSSR